MTVECTCHHCCESLETNGKLPCDCSCPLCNSVVVRHLSLGVTKIVADALKAKFTPTDRTFEVQQNGEGYAILMAGDGDTNFIYLTIVQAWADGFLSAYEAHGR